MTAIILRVYRIETREIKMPCQTLDRDVLNCSRIGRELAVCAPGAGHKYRRRDAGGMRAGLGKRQAAGDRFEGM